MGREVAAVAGREESRVEVQVFVSYRRSDAWSAALRLADALKSRLGEDSVFVDESGLAAGDEWRRELEQRVAAADVVLVVIGPSWAQLAVERSRQAQRHPHEADVLRMEIETAFRVEAAVIPVLVDEATMPSAETLAGPFRSIPELEFVELKNGRSWAPAVRALAESLPAAVHKRRALRVERSSSGPVRSGTERIAEDLIGGRVAVMLGSEFNAIERDRAPGNGAAAVAASELANQLADHFHLERTIPNLAWVSQQVLAAEGRAPLARELRRVVNGAVTPHSVHDFLARLPTRLKELGARGMPLIVSTNYDSALERAFAATKQPYDLVVFLAGGKQRGRFVHIPWCVPGQLTSVATTITEPNDYWEFPIDEDDELERTVIVKLNGGAVELPGAARTTDNFIVTEDDYIGYLTESPVDQAVPVQILNKIQGSHLLFLACPLDEWQARVFLQRVWGQQQVGARSTAIDPAPSPAERRLWQQLNVDVIVDSLPSFIADLETALANRGSSP